MNRKIKDWLVVLILLLDEVAAVALVWLVLTIFNISIPFWFAVVVALLVGVVIFITHRVIIPSFHKKQVTGSEGMLGLMGTVIEPLTPFGIVRVEGEYWKARSVDENVEAGEDVEIVGLDRLTVRVKRNVSPP
jgi:membrane-bound ClpP family serine protease